MTVVSHFRVPKVQQVDLASLFRTVLTIFSNEAVTPKDTFDPGARLNFGVYVREIYPSAAAFPGPHLITWKTAGSSARTGAIPCPNNLVNKEAWLDGYIDNHPCIFQ